MMVGFVGSGCLGCGGCGSVVIVGGRSFTRSVYNTTFCGLTVSILDCSILVCSFSAFSARTIYFACSLSASSNCFCVFLSCLLNSEFFCVMFSTFLTYSSNSFLRIFSAIPLRKLTCFSFLAAILDSSVSFCPYRMACRARQTIQLSMESGSSNRRAKVLVLTSTISAMAPCICRNSESLAFLIWSGPNCSDSSDLRLLITVLIFVYIIFIKEKGVWGSNPSNTLLKLFLFF